METLARLIYNAIISVLLVILVGTGLSLFYQAPQYPNYPALPVGCPVAAQTPERGVAPIPVNGCPSNTNAQRTYQRLNKAYTTASATHARNISLISLGFSVLYVIIGIIMYYSVDIVYIGFELGGLLTFFYGLTNTSNAGVNGSQVQFIDAVVGFIVCLLVGYIFFVRKRQKKA